MNRNHTIRSVFAPLVFALLALALLAPLAHAANATIISPSADIVVTLVNQDPNPAPSGDVVEVRLGVENRGQESLNDLVVEIVPSYPFSLAPGESAAQDIGALTGYQIGENARTLHFNIRVDRDAREGDYPLKVMTYRKGQRDAASVQRTIDVSVSSQESAEVIYINQTDLLPGCITPLKFTIHNVGSAPLRDLTFHWENPDGVILPVGSDDTKYVKYIDIGDSVDLVYNVVASGSATPNLYKLAISLTYTDPSSASSTTLNTNAGVYVGGATDFDVAFSGSANGQVSFSISNIGSVAASSVTVRIPDQPGWRVSGSNAVIIGNLNEGDYTIAGFSLQSAAALFANQTGAAAGRSSGYGRAQGSNGTGSPRNTTSDTVKVEIAYTDSRGNRNTIVKDVKIDAAMLGGTARTGTGARTASAASTSYTWWIVAGVVAIAAALFVRSRRSKGRLKDPHYTYRDAIGDLLMGKSQRR